MEGQEVQAFNNTGNFYLTHSPNNSNGEHCWSASSYYYNNSSSPLSSSVTGDPLTLTYPRGPSCTDSTLVPAAYYYYNQQNSLYVPVPDSLFQEDSGESTICTNNAEAEHPIITHPAIVSMSEFRNAGAQFCSASGSGSGSGSESSFEDHEQQFFSFEDGDPEDLTSGKCFYNNILFNTLHN
jgi:hypothetical protein